MGEIKKEKKQLATEQDGERDAKLRQHQAEIARNLEERYETNARHSTHIPRDDINPALEAVAHLNSVAYKGYSEVPNFPEDSSAKTKLDLTESDINILQYYQAEAYSEEKRVYDQKLPSASLDSFIHQYQTKAEGIDEIKSHEEASSDEENEENFDEESNEQSSDKQKDTAVAESLHRQAIGLYIGRDGITQDRKEAAHLFQQATNEGHPSAPHFLGLCYKHGDGVDKDEKKAKRLFAMALKREKEAAEQAYREGMRYYTGNGAEQNIEKAVQLFQAAAGYPKAMYYLAYCYDNGLGTGRDQLEAERLYKLAYDLATPEDLYELAKNPCTGEEADAEQLRALAHRKEIERGSAKGIYRLALYHYNDPENDITKEDNQKEAARLFKLASNKGHPGASLYLRDCYKHGRGVKKDEKKAEEFYELTKAQRIAYQEKIEARGSSAEDIYDLATTFYYDNGTTEGNQKEAARLFKLAADRGHPDALSSLASCYGLGHGVPQDEKEAARLSSLAQEKRLAETEYEQGMRHHTGEGVEKNAQEAFRLFKAAADKGHPKAECFLGVCYENGLGVAQDNKEAARLYEISAKKGYDEAQLNLGHCYKHGIGVPNNGEEAVFWYDYAARQGNSHAQFNLAQCYQDGTAEQNDTRAQYWLQAAASQDDPDAQNNLAILHLKKAIHILEESQNQKKESKEESKEKPEGKNKKDKEIKTHVKVARFWLEQAAGQGHQLAKENLSAVTSFWYKAEEKTPSSPKALQAKDESKKDKMDKDTSNQSGMGTENGDSEIEASHENGKSHEIISPKN